MLYYYSLQNCTLFQLYNKGVKEYIIMVKKKQQWCIIIRIRTINYLQTQHTPKPKAQSPFDVPPLRRYYYYVVHEWEWEWWEEKQKWK